MDIDYLLIILPSIIFLGVFGLILIIWHGNFRSKKEKFKQNTSFSVEEPSPHVELPTSRREPTGDPRIPPSPFRGRRITCA